MQVMLLTTDSAILVSFLKESDEYQQDRTSVHEAVGIQLFPSLPEENLS